jgi:hypothetical protein
MEDILLIENELFTNENFIRIWKKIKTNGILGLIINKFPFLEGKKISQIMYHFSNKIYSEIKCHCCNKNVRYINFNKGYVKYCSNSCQSKDFWNNVSEDKLKLRSLRSKETCMKKYGVDNPQKSEKVKLKSKNTNIQKYGVEHHLKTTEGKLKIQESVTKKYGVHNISKLESVKSKKLMKSLSKTENEKKSISEKYKKTCLEKYGVTHLSKDADFLEENLKKSFSHKMYSLPSGKIISLQGYEPMALDYLLINYKESDIFTKNSDIEKLIGKFIYKGDDLKDHRYFPDIYIESENRIIEVKSDFTYELDLDNNLKKKQSVIDRNIRFNFFIIYSDGNIKEI